MSDKPDEQPFDLGTFLVGRAPVEPNADLRNIAKTTFELFRAFVDEGFTEVQAIRLCIGIILGANNE